MLQKETAVARRKGPVQWPESTEVSLRRQLEAMAASVTILKKKHRLCIKVTILTCESIDID